MNVHILSISAGGAFTTLLVGVVFEKDIGYVIMEVAYLSGGYFHSVGMVAEVE